MATKKKYYVVWKGRRVGIFNSWNACKEAISGYTGAQYKSFLSYEEAQEAFKNPYTAYRGKKKKSQLSPKEKMMIGEVNFHSIAVDAASSGNPGVMEYRGVDTRTRKVLFHVGPFEQATNNIGEFLAIVHGLAFLHQHKSDRILYTDSRTAISWVRQKKCKTTLKRTSKNDKVFQLIERAIQWLENTHYSTPIVKWETMAWGEIPADFGRK